MQQHNLIGRFRKSKEFIGNYEDKVILNIGSAKSFWLENSILKKAKRVYSCDINSPLENANLFYFSIASVANLPFKDKTFDIVTMFEVLEHIPKSKEKGVIKEIYRVLNKNGKCYISVPNSSFWSNILDPLTFFGHRHYKIDYLTYLLETNNFKILKKEIKGGFYNLLNMLAYYFGIHIMRIRNPRRVISEKKEDNEYNNSNYNGFANIYIASLKKG